MAARRPMIDTDEVMARHRGGESLKRIAADLHVTYMTLRAALIDAGHPLPAPGRRAGVASTVGGTRLTDEVLAERVAAGASTRDIAQEFGLGVSTVNERRRAAGIGPRSAALTAEVLEDLYVRQGMTAAAIAARFKVSQPAVYRRLEAAGISRRRSYPRAETSALTYELLVREYVEAGRTAEDIAEEFGTTAKTVLVRIRAAGLPVRRGGPRRP